MEMVGPLVKTHDDNDAANPGTDFIDTDDATMG